MPAVQSNKVYPSRHAHRRRIRSRAARDKPYSFGDIKPFFEGDVGATVISAHESASITQSSRSLYSTSFGSSTILQGCYFASDFSGAEGPCNFKGLVPLLNASYPSGGLTYPLPYGTSGYAFFDSVTVLDYSSTVGMYRPRGVFPGLMAGLTSYETTLGSGTEFKILEPFSAGDVAIALQEVNAGGSTTYSYVAVNITGPWR